MSALKRQTFAVQNAMSALPPKADMCGATAHVCFGPIADIRKDNLPAMWASSAWARQARWSWGNSGSSCNRVRQVPRCGIGCQIAKRCAVFNAHDDNSEAN